MMLTQNSPFCYSKKKKKKKKSGKCHWNQSRPNHLAELGRFVTMVTLLLNVIDQNVTKYNLTKISSDFKYSTRTVRGNRVSNWKKMEKNSVSQHGQLSHDVEIQ